MDFANDPKVLMRGTTPETPGPQPLSRRTKVMISVAFALVALCAVLAVEIELLHSGELVVLMPE